MAEELVSQGWTIFVARFAQAARHRSTSLFDQPPASTGLSFFLGNRRRNHIDGTRLCLPLGQPFVGLAFVGSSLLKQPLGKGFGTRRRCSERAFNGARTERGRERWTCGATREGFSGGW